MTYPPLDEQQCGNCRYHVLRKSRELTSDFDVLTQSYATREITHSECRRHPPQGSSLGRWPGVGADDWCGEWSPKE
jgi:hypothetical protein